jgi:glycosyltransferase involved in cell wall biosynthesis
LNESQAVGECVRQALETLRMNGISGEVVVCDNGSTDGSAEIAARAGARVVHESRPGYGSAYLRAFEAARGKYIVMADADGTYDFRLIPDFLTPLRNGYDLVMGARDLRTNKDSMSFSHRLGVPILTGFLNVTAGGRVRDAHCGMRAFTREALDKMKLRTTGMEFASEMIVRAFKFRLKIYEVQIPYYARIGESKLNTVRDGWRHVRYLLLESPTFLFVAPGLLMMLAGVAALAALTPGKLQVGAMSFDFHYMIVAALLAILGWQVLTLGLFAKVFSVMEGIAPADRLIERFTRLFSLERGLAVSAGVAAVGLGLLLLVVVSWVQNGFGFPESTMLLRTALSGMTLLVIGMGSFFSSFFLSALLVERRIPTTYAPN